MNGNSCPRAVCAVWEEEEEKEESIHAANSQLAVAIRGASIPSSVQVADRHLGLWMIGGTKSWLALYLFWHL